MFDRKYIKYKKLKRPCDAFYHQRGNIPSLLHMRVFHLEAIHFGEINTLPGGIFGTPIGLDPDFGSQRTRTFGLTRDPPESQFEIVNTINVD